MAVEVLALWGSRSPCEDRPPEWTYGAPSRPHLTPLELGTFSAVKKRRTLLG
jgi:hypothetical protein